jgi:hypothetical protein
VDLGRNADRKKGRKMEQSGKRGNVRKRGTETAIE